jgi:hypothetical protein
MSVRTPLVLLTAEGQGVEVQILSSDGQRGASQGNHREGLRWLMRPAVDCLTLCGHFDCGVTIVCLTRCRCSGAPCLVRGCSAEISRCHDGRVIRPVDHTFVTGVAVERRVVDVSVWLPAGRDPMPLSLV